MKKRTMFKIIRNMLTIHYRCGDISLDGYNKMISILDHEDEILTLGSEE